jgi:hypothetical protein
MNNPSSSYYRLLSLTIGLLFAIIVQEVRSQPPAHKAAGISFENRRHGLSDVDFVLNLGMSNYAQARSDAERAARLIEQTGGVLISRSTLL